MQDPRAAYEKLPYRSWPYRFSSPDHLSAIAFLLGLDIPYASSCRVLEVGCAAGNNLIPAAIRHPASEFIGIDISPTQIAMARGTVARLGLTNIEFLAADLRTFGQRGSPFDFIIAHGVFSWISPEAQRALLALCRANVASNGVIYLSYNCYPGWKTREVLRDAMLTRLAASPGGNPLGLARGIISFLAHHVPADSPMRIALNNDAKLIADADDVYLAHEFLEEENNPIYLRDFLSLSRHYDMRYLSDSRIEISSPDAYDDQITGPLLSEAKQDLPLFEQYVDFVVNRQFRQSLLIPAGLQASCQPFSVERLNSLHFMLPHSATLDRDDDIKASFRRHSTASMSFQQLAENIPSLAGVTTQDVAKRLTKLLQTGRLHPRRLAAVSANRNQINPAVARAWREFAQITAEQGTAFVVDATHHPIVLGPVEACLLPLCDGRQTEVSMMAALMQAVAKEQIVFWADGLPVSDLTQQRNIAADHLAQFKAQLSDRFLSVLE